MRSPASPAETILQNIRFVTIEDPSTVRLVEKGEARELTKAEWNMPIGIGKVRHPFSYAMPKDRKGLRDYCARQEDLVSLEGNVRPTIRDFVDLVFNMTLHYKGDHGVFIKTSKCQPLLWPAHFHKLLAYAGFDRSGDVATIKCKSIEERSSWVADD